MTTRKLTVVNDLEDLCNTRSGLLALPQVLGAHWQEVASLTVPSSNTIASLLRAMEGLRAVLKAAA